jgi:hypothetical protein
MRGEEREGEMRENERRRGKREENRDISYNIINSIILMIHTSMGRIVYL